MTIALIGLLAAGIITLINPKTQIDKGNDARRKSDLTRIQTALELYRSDNGNYPLQASWKTALSSGSTVYLQTIPTDPKTNADYIYTTLPTSACDNTNTVCTGYTLSSCNEYLQDKTNPITDGTAGDTDCPTTGLVTFKVTSP